MAEIDKKTVLLSVMLATLVSMGVPTAERTYFTVDEYENSFYCDVTEEIGVFMGGISGTGLTGYPNEKNPDGTTNRTGQILCKTSDGAKGVWVPLNEYAESLGMSASEFTMIHKPEEESLVTSNRTTPTGGTKQEICHPSPINRCVPI